MFPLSRALPTIADSEDPREPLYTRDMGFDRLVLGVDNLRFDVSLSPGFCQATRKVVRLTMAKIAQAEDILNIKNLHKAVKEREAFKRICAEILKEATYIANSRQEIQIDFLAQTAVFKMILKTVRDQYAEIVESYQRRILVGERAGQENIKETVAYKDRLSGIRDNRSLIIRQTGLELFQLLHEVHRQDLVPLRQANFGAEVLLPDDIFINPLLHVSHPPDDDIMLENYMLLGRRLEDPDRYDALLGLLRSLVGQVFLLEDDPEASRKIERRIKSDACMVELVDGFASLTALQRLKKRGGEKKERRLLKEQARARFQRLNFFFRQFRREGVMKRICAAYAMTGFYDDYCPPLQPRQVLQFLTVRKSRRLLAGRLKAYRKVYRKTSPIAPLRRAVRSLRRISRSEQKELLIRFLKDFIRYHRDFENHTLFSRSMDRIHLVSDRRVLDLSRANKTLFEFLLSHERIPDEKPIVRHVVIKADVRGATDLTHCMMERRLNPASFFSLNFFQPISNILPMYGATKVFIEGDAVILAILEREGEPSQWYAVARACGLAVQILMIIDRYNARSRQNQLPVLEVGCGINYRNRPPAFLFDGDSRIMISPAINLADRMSGCTRALRGRSDFRKGPFHLRVFQAVKKQVQAKTRDDLCIRYNVNGIELNWDGFKKLSQEIRLTPLEYVQPGPKPTTAKLYTGKFPTVGGQYQRLIIREARIPEVGFGSVKVLKLTDRKYYEVCASTQLYEYVRDRLEKSK